MGFLFLTCSAFCPAAGFSLHGMLRSHRLLVSPCLFPPVRDVCMHMSPAGEPNAARVPGSDGPIWQHRGMVWSTMATVHQNGVSLEYASEELRTDREVVLAAVHQNGVALEYASEELRTDREVVLAAVHQNGVALEYASQELRTDREVVLAAVRQNGLAFKYAYSVKLRTDREVVLAAVHQNGLAFKWAYGELQGDREVTLAAVHQNGLAFKWASSEELQGDYREVALAAVHQNGLALKWAGELREDRKVVLAAVHQNGLAFKHTSLKLRGDHEVALAAMHENADTRERRAGQQRVPECESADLQEDGALAGGVVWAGFQVALRRHFSALMESVTATPCFQRFRLEALAALPGDEHTKLLEFDEVVREMDAAEAVWYRLKEECRKLQNEGEVQAAKQTFERAEKAEIAYKDCRSICVEACFEGRCRTGAAEKIEKYRRELADVAQLAAEARKLKAQGKEQAAQEVLWRIDVFTEQSRARWRELAKAHGCLEEFHHACRDADADVPRGTTARLEALERSFQAAPPEKNEKDEKDEKNFLTERPRSYGRYRYRYSYLWEGRLGLDDMVLCFLADLS